MRHRIPIISRFSLLQKGEKRKGAPGTKALEFDTAEGKREEKGEFCGGRKITSRLFTFLAKEKEEWRCICFLLLHGGGEKGRRWWSQCVLIKKVKRGASPIGFAKKRGEKRKGRLRIMRNDLTVGT